jgi:hypothetical protein
MITRVGALTVATLAVGAASAQAKIVLDTSIANVALGATRAEVRATLGAPAREWEPSVPTADNSSFWDFKNGLRLGFRDHGDVVTLLLTTSRKERTSSGLGVGSTRAAVRRKLKGETCTPDFCQTGDDSLGKPNTLFTFGRGGRVQSVTVLQRPDSYRP